MNSIFEKFDPKKRAQIIALLEQPVLARLATANLNTGQPHVVPLWYRWDGESMWISGFGSTRKFRELSANPNCAILVEPANPKENQIQGVLFEGAASILTDDRERVEETSTQIYLRYLGEAGTLEAEPQSWIHDPDNLVARLKPTKVFAW